MNNLHERLESYETQLKNLREYFEPQIKKEKEPPKTVFYH